MKLTINATEINVTNAYPYQRPNGKRELRITVPQTEIEYAELKELLKGDTGEIVLTKEDGSAEAFLGYHTTAAITDKVEKIIIGETENNVEVWYIELDCVGEAERKALEAEYKAKEAERKTQALAQLLEQQNLELAALNEQLLVTQLAVVEMHEASKAVEPEVVEPTEPEVIEPEETTEPESVEPEVIEEGEE